ncbi:Sas10/Utp3/C1D [Macrophomina phaseolina MS6]|uniref:Sas10/Utp3/C1D n=2 Tax=Macrophomina phaseolina TaxID=35725 RepID=K2R9U0_MACPH|nr:Sas10/Utp3/C1D [Macrophomina phaseolina MS6]KAH7031979.1 Sas10 C-terminal domain-containing protein [Macrophomina phaseolina]
MAKKRKASGQPKPSKSDAQSSKLAVNTYEDVADSEDEFHINRDKILLDEGPEAKRRRKWQEEDRMLEPSDEEVLAYSDQSEDDEDQDDYDGPTGRRGEASHESDSEVPEGEEEGEEEEEEDEAWGVSKKDYYNADAIETEQDALDEEKEALRLQKKHLERMTEADFGFDESEWLDADKEDAEEADGEVVTEVLPQLQITDDMSPADRLKLLKTRYPEFEPLSKEFLDLQPLYNELALAAAAAQKMQQQRAARITGRSKNFKTPAAVIKYRALAAYLAALTMYFALLTSTSSADGNQVVALSPAELRDHPVMEGLVECRELWSRVKGLSIANKIADSDTSNELEAIEEEADDDVSPMDIEPRTSEGAMAPPKAKKKTKAQRTAEAAQAAAEAKRAERLRKTEEELAALSSLTDKSALRKTAKAKKPAKSSAANFANDEDSDFGDETELSKHELDEKLRKKKSLRFYTSQIAQKQNKRGAAGKDIGGDADIPYRERLKDRQARLMAEAEKRGKKALLPEQELGGESDEEDRRQARQIRDEAASEDDEYYDMVAARSKQKKADKAAAAAAYAQAAREGAQVVETEEIGEDGKRKISYAIAKNKGLTPHRKKDVRNPRVKKKKKYEEKKKKLSSIRQVYKGGEGRGGYKGELTGIKKGLVKSIKL